MAPTDTEVSTAMTIIETVMITLPIWLAGIKYYLDEFEPESGEGELFASTMVLIYVSLAAILVSSGTVITSLGNDQISSSVYGFWMVFLAAGVLALRFIPRRMSGHITKVTLWFVIGSGSVLIGIVFLLFIGSSI